jgi:hypothetical protein
MRFLGPRSISSLLKTALDVVYYGLYSLIAVVVALSVCLLSVPNLASEAVRRFNVDPTLSAGSMAFMLMAFGASLAGYLLITHWTRQIFRTLAEGDVFHPDNTIRLRWIGFGLGALEVFGYLTRGVASGVFHLHFEPVYGLRAVTTWFAVLVVFVLAEVFKEGARLRQEVDHTI